MLSPEGEYYIAAPIHTVLQRRNSSLNIRRRRVGVRAGRGGGGGGGAGGAEIQGQTNLGVLWHLKMHRRCFGMVWFGSLGVCGIF